MPIIEEFINRVEELNKEDKQLLIKNGPIFEWIPGNIIMDKEEDEEDFDNLINYLQHYRNYNNDRYCVPDAFDEDDDSLGSWES